MPTKCAIIGLDILQQDWIAAIQSLVAAGELQVIAAGHATTSLAKDLGDAFAVPHFDDLRQLMLKATPQVIILDRPDSVSLEFLTACVQENIAIFSLGPPVRSLTEAQTLQDLLGKRSHLLYVSPRFVGSQSYKHCAQADEYVQPAQFAAAQWFAWNHRYAKTQEAAAENGLVRSLSVLAWDALDTLIALMGLPETVFANIRGTTGRDDQFADITGFAALSLRFPDRCVVNLSLCDQLPHQRSLTLAGRNGALQLSEQHYRFTDPTGRLIDEGAVTQSSVPHRNQEELHIFLEQFAAQPSPHRGFPQRLEEIAATMEAMLVSHRTNAPESPEHLRQLRR